MSDTTTTNRTAPDPDDEFERLGRRAGAEFRQDPPPGSLGDIQHSAQRRTRNQRIAGAAGVIAVAAVVIGGIVWTGRDDASPAGADTDVIAYQEFLGSRYEIFLVGMDGSDRRSVGASIPGGDQVNPAWSPDGTRLAFGVADGTRDDIWLVSPSGDDPDLLVDCVDDCVALMEPTWSPDGSRIVFARIADTDAGGVSTLEMIDLQTRDITVLVTAAPRTGFAGPVWSPDGSAIVAEVVETDTLDLTGEPTGVTLVRFDLDGDTITGSTPLTEPDRFAATAEWSPDGSTIVYSARPLSGDGESELFVMAPDGTGERQLTTLTEQGGAAKQPAFTADGSTVVFVARLTADGEDGLARIDLDGGDITPAGSDEFRFGLHPAPAPN